jgi:hypothetical protein
MANISPMKVSHRSKLHVIPARLNFMSDHVPDKVDRAIMARLQQDGRIANVDLADAVGLSPSSCLRRVKAL